MLSSFLLSKSTLGGKKTTVDSGLDAIFAASAKSGAPVPIPIAVSIPQPLSSNVVKRKRNDDGSIAADDSPKKRRTNLGSERTSTAVDNKISHTSQSQKKEIKRAGKGVERGTSKDDRIQQLEENYSKQRLESPEINGKGKSKGKRTTVGLPVDTEASTSKAKIGVQQDEASSSSDDNDPSTLVHEALTGSSRHNNRRKVHYVPEGETKERRDQRTIFIGNLPVEIVNSKSLQKSLRRYVLSFCSTSTDEVKFKIESMRFRSVAFKAPTNLQVLKEGDDASESPRRQERAAAWKKEHKEVEVMDEDAPKPIEYLTPSEKKRIAFIKGEFHDEAASVNAYVVFAYPDPGSTETMMDPFKAAALVAEKMNGGMFGARTLRVDLANKGDSTNTAGTRDPAATIFVGSLDFSADEESLRTFFETLLTTEMGPPKQLQHSDEGSDDSDEEKEAALGAMDSDGPSRWVHDVRIIRDKDTQLGKGFAYVRFSERTCVDEILAMEPSKIKFAKRKLRVERCKGGEAAHRPLKPTGGPGRSVKGAAKDGAKDPRSKPPRVKTKGDPLLGERLKGLSKEERREIKKSDPTRQARRMEKKKVRVVMEKGMTAASKERVRVRKGKNLAKAKGKQKPKASS
ncbi:hypothetical protein FRC18_008449 [Serendipita sp. 400]|nr:hypothetical protein FRC18_008449 [Serendipita sp. 400]